MELNADFTRRAAVHAASLDWTPSPIAGVDRRMLDRVGDEVARATSIVRYAPNSRFSRHTHDGGEEILVLDGVFEDEHGAFPAGSYLRNPPGSAHTPGSTPGCVIFVKLWQFDPTDRTQVRLDTVAIPDTADKSRPGVHVQPLFQDAQESVRLERWEANARVVLPSPEGLEVLVLEGSFADSGERFTAQSWLRLPPAASLNGLAGADGCRVWIKAGRANTRPPPLARSPG